MRARRPRWIRFCGACALAGGVLVGRMAPATIVDRIAAAVNDIAIPESELAKALAVSALPRAPGETDQAYRSRVLEALIDEKLEYEDARRFGPTQPDAADVEAALNRLRQRLEREGKDPAVEFARASATPEEVRASVERQLLIRRYLQERFRPISFADEDRAREEYEKIYLPERRAAGLAVPPFESVVEEMRGRSQQRVYNEEVEKWIKELRQKARITIYEATPRPAQTTPRVLFAAPTTTGR